MSYTFPHYASQSPVASYQSARTITHYMEHAAGRQTTHHEPTSDDEEAQIGSSQTTNPVSRQERRSSGGYGAISARRRASRGEFDWPQPINPTGASETSALLAASPALAFDAPEGDERGGAGEPNWITEDSSEDGSGTPDSISLDGFGSDDNVTWARRALEAKVVTRYAFPILITQLLDYSLLVASVISIGHLSTIELAASTLGSMTSSVTGYSIIVGMASALDSLLPQAWGAVGDQKRLVGLWTLRMSVVLVVTLVPIYAVWHTSEDILLLLKQDPQVAELAALYLKWMSLGLPAYCFNYVVRKYYQSIGLLNLPTFIIIVIAPINAFLNYVLVWGPGPFKAVRLGFIGAPIATTISFNLMSIIYLIHLLLRSPKEAWFPVKDRKTLEQVFSGEALGFLVRLGVAGVGQTASEWWSWELVGLAASLLGPVTLASQSVLLVSASTSYQLSFAVSAAASVRVGNLIGSGHAAQAEVSSHMSFILIILASLFSSTIFLIFRNKWAYLFNDDIEVVALVAKVLPLVALFQILDGLGAMIGTVLRVTGRQFTGALLNLTGYYAIGIPIGMILTFYFPDLHLGLLGLWIGLSIALAYTAIIGLWYCLRTDWHLEVQKTKLRLKGGESMERGS